MKFNFEKNKKGNPIKTSPVSEYLELNEMAHGIPYSYHDANGNIVRTFFKMFKDQENNEYIEKNPNLKPQQQDLKTEYMVSLLIKGDFHSSDIIKKDDKYFSKIINLDQTKEPENGELEAEIFLLRYVFSDWDKKAPNDNIIMEGKKFSHYDYSEAFRGNREKDFQFGNKTEDLTKATEKELLKLEKNSIPEIHTKSNELLSKIEDDVFWDAIIKKSEFETNGDRFSFLTSDNKIEELRNILKGRLEKIIEITKHNN